MNSMRDIALPVWSRFLKGQTRFVWKDHFYFCAHRSGLTRWIGRRFGGSGSILLFHEIHDDLPSQLKAGVSPALLDAAINWAISNGWEFTNLDEAVRRLSRPEPTKRFISLTFDDGYRDNLIHALPVLERHSVPFTLYVPTGAITRSLYSWWLGLRRLFLIRETVDIEGMGIRFCCQDLGSKRAGLAEVERWIHRDYRRKAMLEPTFRESGISLAELNEQHFLSPEELVALSRHPLATIGAHTASHAALATLNAVSVRREILENRQYLENLLQKPIQHFAYPYGDARACGPREGAIAAEMGFRTGATARQGQLWPEHVNYPHALPRIAVNAETSIAALDARVSGLKRGLRGGKPAVVTW
jgi:peptidoglycan/xylan/chitin deacetylase (PgdA/CDA1 family)